MLLAVCCGGFFSGANVARGKPSSPNLTCVRLELLFQLHAALVLDTQTFRRATQVSQLANASSFSLAW